MRRTLNLLPSLMAVLVGAASFAVSYNTLRLEAVAVQAVAPGWPSYLLPLLLDGGVLSGSAVLWKASVERRNRPAFAFAFVAALVVLSVVANIAHAGPSPLAKVIAALPPLVLLGCLELVQIAHRSHPTPQPTSAPQHGEQVAAPDPATGAAPNGPGLEPAPSVPAPALAVHVQPPAAEPAAATAPEREAHDRVAHTDDATAAGDTGADAPFEVPAQHAEAALETVASTPTRRAVRVTAASPLEDSHAGPAQLPGQSAGEIIRDGFMTHVQSGGDPEDKSLATRLATQAGVSPAYARKVLRPLRTPADAVS